MGVTGEDEVLPVNREQFTAMDIVYRKNLRHLYLPGQAHELTFSCYQRLPLLSRDRTCCWLIDAIENTRHKQGYSVFAFA
ncbi:MAG: hypothetical protein ABFD50_01915, partial [Smithella sp.]